MRMESPDDTQKNEGLENLQMEIKRKKEALVLRLNIIIEATEEIKEKVEHGSIPVDNLPLAMSHLASAKRYILEAKGSLRA